MDLLPTATAVEESARRADVAVLPVGSFEQHGAHLPLATDTIVACLIALRLAERYSLLLLPPVTISCSHEHESLGITGTVSVSARTLYDMISDIASSLRRSGIHKVVLISGHGGNYVLSNIVQEANAQFPRSMLLYPGRSAVDAARADAGCQTSTHDDMHGGEWETSILLDATTLVRDSWQDSDHLAPDRPDLLVDGMAPYTSNGIIGQPSLATPAKGAAILDSLTASFADRLAALHAADELAAVPPARQQPDARAVNV